MATTLKAAPTPEGGLLSRLSSLVPLQLQQPQQPQPPSDDMMMMMMTTTTNAVPPDVEHMQVELAEMRKAFQEYMATTQDLEVNIDMELQEMQGKLDESTEAYETLTGKLKTMEPMLRSLELSLGGTKKRLKEEAKLRRMAEVAQIEAESRVQQVGDENKVLHEECDALRAELEQKNRQTDQLKREHEASRRQLEEFSSRLSLSIKSRREGRAEEPPLMNIDSGVVTEAVSNKSRVASAEDESCVEILDELETVTEQLITTQQKLWRTEDLLRESEARSSSLQADIRMMKDEQKSHGNDKGLMRELEQTRTELAQTKRELEKSEADQTKNTDLKEPESEVEDKDDQIEQLMDEMEEAEYRLKMSQDHIGALEVLLEESQEENIRLVEEIASLRIILQDDVTAQDSEANMKESISKEVRTQVLREANEVREKEISALRQQFKKIFRENTELKEKMEKLESGHPSLGDYKLKKDVESLNLELLQMQDEHKKAVLEIELSWKKKLEQVMTGEFIPEDLLEEMEVEMKTAIDSAADRIRILQADKEALEDRVESLARELEFSGTKISGVYTRLQESEGNLKASRDEILRLKKSNTHLTSELEYTTRIMSRMDTECERLTRQHSELKAELEVALQVIESAGLDQDTVHTEESMKAKEKIHRLTSNLNKLKGDYSALLNELEATREHFLDAQVDAAQQKEAELKALSEKIVQLEEALERATIENKDLSKKLHAARQKHKDPNMEVKTRMVLQEELEAATRSISDLENEMKGSNPGQRALQKELKQCKDALSSSRIENKRLEEEIGQIRAETSTVSRNQLSRDLDPVDETLNRDPLSILRSPRSGESGASSILKELTRENKSLREKIPRVMNKDSSDLSENMMDKLKDQLFSKIEELRTLEDNFFELKGVLRATEEKLRESESAIDQSSDESLELRNEVKTLKAALRDAHRDHSETAHQLESAQRECRELRRSVNDTAMSGVRDGTTLEEELELQIQKLKDEKLSHQHQVDDAKIALSVSEYAQERLKEELRTSQAKLEKSQANVRKLKEDLQKLAGAFSCLRNDHEVLLADFESSTYKKAVVTENTVADDSLRLQLKKLAEENSDLQRVVSESKQKMLEYQNEIDHKSQEIESLMRNLLTTQEEARRLSQEITNLSTAFENAQAEYDAVVDELDAMQSLFEKSRKATEKESGVDVLQHKLAGEGEQQKRYLTEQLEKAFSENLALQRKLHEAELSLSGAKKILDKNSVFSGFEKENEILRQALDDSEAESKALKERCFKLEVLVKQTSKTADEEVDGHQCMDDKVLTAVFDSVEMQELKEQFDAIVEENINLGQVVRQSDIALTLAKDVVERNKGEMTKLESDVSNLKSAKVKLQEEVYNLTVELERSNEDHLAVLEEARAATEAEIESKTQSLKYQISALTIENSSLRNRMQKLASDASLSYDQFDDELRKLKRELQHNLDEKNTINREKAALQANLLEVETSSNQQLVAMQVSNLQKELQKGCQQREELLTELNERKTEQYHSVQADTEAETDENLMRADFEATMEVFERINSLLASVDFLERHHEINLLTSHANLTSTSQKAEEIRRKIAFLTYAFQKEKKEHSDIIFQLKSSQNIVQNNELVDLEEKHRELEEKLEATEIALKAALDSEERHKVELERSKKKYQETQNAAKSFKEQVLSLQGRIKDSQRGHSTLEAAEGRADGLVFVRDVDGKGGTNENKEFRRVSEENKELMSRLEETEAALAAARSMKSAYEKQLRQFDSDDSSVDPETELFGSHMSPLNGGNLDNIRSSQDYMQEALISVRQRLENIQNEGNFAMEYEELSPHTQAELRLLKSQFQKLNEQSDSLAKKVKSAEDAVTTVRDKQSWLKDKSKVRESLTEQLKSQIEQSKERNLELGELACLMESRLNLTEESVDKLEHELSATRSSVEISRTGLLINQGQESAARLSELVKQRPKSTTRSQHVLSTGVESDKIIPERSIQEKHVLVEDETEKEIVEIGTMSSHSVAPTREEFQEIRDDSDCGQTTSRGTVTTIVSPSSNVWSISLSSNIVSAVATDTTVSEGEPPSPLRSISPFTLSLLSDNKYNSNDIYGAEAFDMTMSQSGNYVTQNQYRIDDTDEEEDRIMEEEVLVIDDGHIRETHILETRGDYDTEQRE